LFFTSFFLAPAIFFIQNGNLNSFWSFSDDGPFSYFIRNIVLPNHLQTGIKDVTLATPFGNATGLDTINGSLWTLPLEVRCYLLAFFITRFSPKRFKGILLIFSLCFLFCFLSFKAGLGLEIDNKTEWSLYLVFFFLLGAVVCQYSLKTSSFLRLSLTFFILGAIFPIETRILLLLPFVLAMLLWFSLGIHVKALKDYVADFSFGFYIWAWPITQCTALLFPSNHAHVAFILTIGALTFTFSAFSWYLIERPSLLRKLYW
jgi:peptidoglycan/LPS O-acetylase OafA/YrhL